jgi:hypothetical protein
LAQSQARREFHANGHGVELVNVAAGGQAIVGVVAHAPVGTDREGNTGV